MALERLYMSGLRLADLLTLILGPKEDPVYSKIHFDYPQEVEMFTKAALNKDKKPILSDLFKEQVEKQKTS